MKLFFNKYNKLLFIFISIFTIKSVKAEYTLIELRSDFDFGKWYKAQTTYTPNPKWFGAWAIAPKGNEIYFGFGTSRPAEYDGALLAKWSNDSLVKLGTFSEQGIHCLQWLDDTLYSIGSDPSITDGWDGGNFYKYVIGKELVKVRYDSSKKPILPNVLHSWGFCIDPESKIFYMGTGSYDPSQYYKNKGDCGTIADSNLACFGELWQSENFGTTWELNSGGRENPVSEFRIYDLIKFRENLYIVDGSQTKVKLRKSSNNGKTWEDVINVIPSALYRMTIFKDKLIIGAANARKIYLIDSNSIIENQILPGVLNYSFNPFVNVENKYFISFFSDGSIRATDNFIDWKLIIPQTSKNFLALSYWEFAKSLIISERDSIGKIYQINIADLLSTGIFYSNNKDDIEFTQTNNEIRISGNLSEISNFDIFDILGNKVTTENQSKISNNTVKINISNLSKGIYFLLYSNSNKCKIMKIMKN